MASRALGWASPWGSQLRVSFGLQVAHAGREAMPHQGGTWPSECLAVALGISLGSHPHMCQGRPLGLEATSPTMMEVAGLAAGLETRLPGRSLPEYRLRKPVESKGRPCLSLPSLSLVLQRAEGLQVPSLPQGQDRGLAKAYALPARRA